MFDSIRSKLIVPDSKYLYAGVWNTLFGYLSGVFIFKIFENNLSVIVIGVIANALSISMSFFTYKIFVFQTVGNWLQEYLRSYVVYGAMAIFSIFSLDILINYLKFNIWTAQALTIILGVIISYLGHRNFTFKVNK